MPRMVCLLLLAGALALAGAAPASAGFANDFSIAVECVTEVTPTTYTATFHWTSAHDTQMTQTGANNTVTSGGSPGAPPTLFAANSEGDWVTSAVSKTATVRWQLGGAVDTANWKASPRCYEAPDVLALPDIVGRFAVGETISLVGERYRTSVASWEHQYFWTIGCENPGTARLETTDEPRYTLKAQDVGRAISVIPQIVEPYPTGAGAYDNSMPCDTSRVVRTEPANTGAPSVAGDAVVGSTLSLTGGTWTGTGLVETVVWERCTTAGCVTAGTGASHVVGADDAGRTLRARVTNTNPVGAFSVTTAPTAAVRTADATPPQITATIGGAAGEDGWRTGDATVSWSVSDDGSAVGERAGCGPVTVTTDRRVVLTCTATSDGGSATETVEVKRDASPPSTPAFAGIVPGPVSADRLPPADAVACTATDATSGATCAVSGFSAAVGAHTLTATARNGAGLTSTSTLTYEVTAPAPRSGIEPAADAILAGLRDVRAVRFGSSRISFTQGFAAKGRATWTFRLGTKKLGTARATITKTGRRTVRLQLGRAARSALRARPRTAVTVRTTFGAVTADATLKRPRR